MRHNCATQVLTQTHNILKAGDLCHHALMMCWSVRNKKGSRTLSTWTQIQTAHTKLSTSSLCVFEATQTLWGFPPPSSSVINTSSSEYHTSKKKNQKLPEADSSHSLRSNVLLQLEAAGPETPTLWACFRHSSTILTSSPDKLLTPTYSTDWGANIF